MPWNTPQAAEGWTPPQAIEATAEQAGLRWKVWDEEQPAYHLYHGRLFVGEVYGTERDDKPVFRWHSKVTDWRSREDDVEVAKALLLHDYLHHLAMYGGEVLHLYMEKIREL